MTLSSISYQVCYDTTKKDSPGRIRNDGRCLGNSKNICAQCPYFKFAQTVHSI